MSYSYSLNCGQYVLMDDDRPVGRVLDEVSIAFDLVDGVLHKHGAPSMVEKWLDETKAKLLASGLAEMAGNLSVMTGRFALADLNRCLTTSGYALQIYLKVIDRTLSPQPLPPAARVAPPVRRVLFRR